MKIAEVRGIGLSRAARFQIESSAMDKTQCNCVDDIIFWNSLLRQVLMVILFEFFFIRC